MNNNYIPDSAHHEEPQLGLLQMNMQQIWCSDEDPGLIGIFPDLHLRFEGQRLLFFLFTTTMHNTDQPFLKISDGPPLHTNTYTTRIICRPTNSGNTCMKCFVYFCMKSFSWYPTLKSHSATTSVTNYCPKKITLHNILMPIHCICPRATICL